MRSIFLLMALAITTTAAIAQKNNSFNGLDVNLSNIYRVSNAKTRSISPENFTGEPGKGGMATLENGSAKNEARELGQGWKVSPYVVVKKGTTFTLGEITGAGWWGEGEIKFFMDGDTQFPTINGTGTEDYFCGSYNFDVKGKYTEFSTAYAGLHQVIRPDGLYNSQQRFGMYRWHLTDPVRFEKDLKITIQDLGWKSGGRYLQQQSDISSVVFWYQLEPHVSFPKLPAKDQLEQN